MISNTKNILNNYKEIKDICLEGWVKSNRDNGSFGFIMFNDGSDNRHIQIVYKKEITDGFDDAKLSLTGSAIYIEGEVVVTPEAKQPFEILAKKIILLKKADEDYPLQKKRHTVEYLREIAHLRPATNLFLNIMRVRSELTFIIHSFFHENGYTLVTAPVLTSNDAEGAGEAFKIAKIDGEDFFNLEATLSVTGQLHAEAYALAFKNVYTFGPQFRAEKSHTNRHAAEFWMLEPEVSFMDIDGLMNLMELMLKYIVKHYRTKCEYEINFFNEFVDNQSINRLAIIENENFARVSYTEVIEILKNDLASNKTNFENTNIFWGMDLESEHEKYICEKVFNKPTFVYNYPSELKAFYMKENDDQKTVAGVDLLVPGVGELCGGSQREANYNILLSKAKKTNANLEELQWYIDLRKYGYYKSSGFGLGFERLIMFLTGVSNIRDVIPFARTHGNIKF